MVTPELVHAILDQHSLKGSRSIHMSDHWARVMENGRRLAGLTGARLDVIELFAVFHDSGRKSDFGDHDHGSRGALIAQSMHGRLYELDETGLRLLVEACRLHTAGKTEADVTVQTCWDSDRLDLLRAGIRPSARRLCTQAARDPQFMEWANLRSAKRVIPADIYAEWGLG